MEKCSKRLIKTMTQKTDPSIGVIKETTDGLDSREESRLDCLLKNDQGTPQGNLLIQSAYGRGGPTGPDG